MPDTWVKDGNVQFQALGYWVGDESNDQQQQYVKNGFVYDLLGKTFFGKNLVEIYKFNGPNEESNNHEGSAGKEEYLKIHSNPGGLVLIGITYCSLLHDPKYPTRYQPNNSERDYSGKVSSGFGR